MKKSRMQQMSLEVTVGAFMFMVLLALGFFTIILSSENIFTRKERFEVRFDRVMGLREGDGVTVRGLKVGKVTKMWLQPDGVHLHLSIEETLTVRENYVVKIQSSSVLGGQHIDLYEGSVDAEALPAGTVLIGVPPVDIIDEATETFGGLRTALTEGGILENLEVTMAEMRRLAENLNRGEGTLGKLISDDEAYTRLVAVATNLEAITARVQAGEGTLGRLLADDTVYRNVESTTENLRVVSQRLRDGEGTLGKLMSEDEELYTNLRDAVAALREISTKIANGEGTLGRLTTDDSLFEEAQLLLQEVRAAVDDFRETSPITSFTSLFFGVF